MTTARAKQVSIDATPYYHCVSRCVKRSFLCGKAPGTKQSYEHRRGWISKKLQSLSFAYCIDVCAYAIMSNHYHLVLHINREKALQLSNEEVVERWGLEHKIPLDIQRFINGQISNKTEQKESLEIIARWRKRLWSLSWFMKEINFEIASKANKEDDCKGHFWESRFKSQALLDEKALAAAMAYVDLNPIRANIAKTPESSEFTSIQARLKALDENIATPPCLHPFIGCNNQDIDGIPFSLIDYIELVDWTARQFREGKASMADDIPPILQRLSFTTVNWLTACTQLEKQRITAIGCSINLAKAKEKLNKTRLHLYKLE